MTGSQSPEPSEPDDVQFCSFCGDAFPIDDPMVNYDGSDYCSPNCVRESLLNDEPCDHAQYVASVQSFQQKLGRILANDAGPAPDPVPGPK